jgi:hypothetical protein
MQKAQYYLNKMIEALKEKHRWSGASWKWKPETLINYVW